MADRHRDGECLDCGREKKVVGRGLCASCYRLDGQSPARAFPLLTARRTWSPREVAAAVAMRAAGLRSGEVARELGRTKHSVKEMFRRLGRARRCRESSLTPGRPSGSPSTTSG